MSDASAVNASNGSNAKKHTYRERQKEMIMIRLKEVYRKLTRQANELAIANLPSTKSLIGLLTKPPSVQAPPNAANTTQTYDEKEIQNKLVSFYRAIQRNAFELMLQHLPPPDPLLERLLSLVKADQKDQKASRAKVDGTTKEKKKYFDSDEERSDCESLTDTADQDERDAEAEAQYDADNPDPELNQDGFLRDLVAPDE